MFTPPRPTREFLLADDGSTTVEYVIGILTAATLAITFLALVKGDVVVTKLGEMLDRALTVN
jgi:hypothetical protein